MKILVSVPWDFSINSYLTEMFSTKKRGSAEIFFFFFLQHYNLNLLINEIVKDFEQKYGRN